MSQPLVSVIIPTYNRAEFLREAIQSVLAQTYTNFELLILDNCSPDHTPEVVAEFDDARIKYLRHQCNIGGIANWIYGMHWAKGDFFSVLGDDDFYRSHFIESRVKAFECFPGVDAVFSGYELCDENGSITSESPQYSDQDCVLKGRGLLEIINAKAWQVGSTIFRRSTVVDMWDESIRAGKAFDTAVQVRLALNSSAAWIVDKGLVYRTHEQQDSHIGGRGILIGLFNAFVEPLVHEDHPASNNQLKNGAWWAYDILARDSLVNGKIRVAQKILWQLILLKPFCFRTWVRLIYSCLPLVVRVSISNKLKE
jgi:glycosyltransferase involved in cell wall biosynthesis